MKFFKPLFLRKLTKLALLAFLLGALVWFTRLRVFQISNENTYAVVFLQKDFQVGSRVVFQYPHIESPYYSDTVESVDPAQGVQLKTQTEIFVPSELIMGRVIYVF